MIRNKSGPVHFYVTPERDAFPTYVVEYCVQVGERQYISRSQARALVGDGKVKLDGSPLTSPRWKIQPGAHTLTIRGKTHHVVVHGCEKE